MPDRAKVIKALECCDDKGSPNCEQCPYMDDDFVGTCASRNPLFRDALELLKESRQTEWERNTAFDQLRQIGKSCGEKMDDIAWVLQRPGHGRWERLTGMAPPEYHGHKICSVCGCLAPYNPLHPGREELSRYCPGCGARMDGGRDEQ